VRKEKKEKKEKSKEPAGRNGRLAINTMLGLLGFCFSRVLQLTEILFVPD
jgi:hypothetical protein